MENSSIGNTSSAGCFSIVMLVLQRCKLEDHESSTFLKPNIVGWGLNIITPSGKRNALDLEKQIRQNDSTRLMQWRVSTHNFPTSSVMSFLFAITSWWFKGLSILCLISSQQTAQPSLQSQTSENWRCQIWKIGKSKKNPWFYNQFSDLDAPIIFRNPPKTQLLPRDRLQISMYHPQLMGMG